MTLSQIIDCQTGEIKNVDTETGKVIEIIQPATVTEEQPTNNGE